MLIRYYINATVDLYSTHSIHSTLSPGTFLTHLVYINITNRSGYTKLEKTYKNSERITKTLERVTVLFNACRYTCLTDHSEYLATACNCDAQNVAEGSKSESSIVPALHRCLDNNPPEVSVLPLTIIMANEQINGCWYVDFRNTMAYMRHCLLT